MPRQSDRRSPFTILLAGENQAVLQMIESLLERNGYIVLVGRSGPEVIRLARQELPAAILMDMVLPLQDGHACARVLRRDRTTCQIPIIGYNAPRNKDAGLNSADERVLLEQIEAALEIRYNKNCYALSAPARERR